MRVTSNSFPDTLVSQLSSLAGRQNRLQNQAATGQLIKLPEDDPAAMERVLTMQKEASASGQYQKNIVRQQEIASSTYGALSSLKKISDRAGEITTLADGLKSPEELKDYATEVNELIKQAAQLANSKDGNNFLFAGTKSDQAAFTVTTDVNGNVTAVGYQGNDTVPQHEVGGGVTLSSQVPGANSTGSGPRGLLVDSRSGADFFNHLISLRDNLEAGNTGAIATTNKADLGKDEDNFLFQISYNGAMQSRLETTGSILKDRVTTLNSQVSNVADADLATTLVQLSQTQSAYQAALQSAGKMLGVSLMDYLQ